MPVRHIVAATLGTLLAAVPVAGAPAAAAPARVWALWAPSGTGVRS